MARYGKYTYLPLMRQTGKRNYKDNFVEFQKRLFHLNMYFENFRFPFFADSKCHIYLKLANQLIELDLGDCLTTLR